MNTNEKGNKNKEVITKKSICHKIKDGSEYFYQKCQEHWFAFIVITSAIIAGAISVLFYSFSNIPATLTNAEKNELVDTAKNVFMIMKSDNPFYDLGGKPKTIEVGDTLIEVVDFTMISASKIDKPQSGSIEIFEDFNGELCVKENLEVYYVNKIGYTIMLYLMVCSVSFLVILFVFLYVIL